MKNRRIVLFCISTVVILLFIGCGGNKTNSNNAQNITSVAKNDGCFEHYKYSVLTFEGSELLGWPIVKEAMNKFNVEFDLVTIQYDTWSEKVRTIVAAGDLPEFVAWYNFDYGEYANWAKQGIFKVLPDLSMYPNIKNELDSIEADDSMLIDGKLYCIPKTMKNPIDGVGFENFYYRKDWADKLGYRFKPVQDISWGDFIKYLKDILEKDPGAVGKDKLIPLDMESGYNDILNLVQVWNPDVGKYIKKDGKYVWGTALPSTVEALKSLRQMYKDGLLSKDFYTYKMNEGANRFRAGRVAVRHSSLSPAYMQLDIDLIKKGVPGFKDEDYGILVVKSPDGKVHCPSKFEFWGASAYSAKIDNKKMDRMLRIHNWALDPQTVEYFAFGVPGVDWERNGDKIELKWPKDDKGEYQLTEENGKGYIRDQWLFQKWFKLEGDDVWIPGNPFYRPYIIKLYEDAQNLKVQVGTHIMKSDWNVQFFSAPNKNKYGDFQKDIIDELTTLIISSRDIEKDWNDWVKSVEPKVKLILDELDSGLVNR